MEGHHKRVGDTRLIFRQKYYETYGWIEWVDVICGVTGESRSTILHKWNCIEFLNEISRLKSKAEFIG